MGGYKAGDLFLVSGEGFFSKGIRKFTQGKGEAKTIATHVGIIVRGGSPNDSIVIEALGSGVERRPFMQGPGKETHAVYRMLNVSSSAIAAGVALIEQDKGQKYGWGKIGLQALDFLIPHRDKKGQPPFFFRRLGRVPNMPICSVEADKFAAEVLVTDLRERLGDVSDEMVQLNVRPFGLPRETVTPDDIMDFAENHPEKYLRVRIMGPP